MTTERKRFISIRVTNHEWKEIQRHFKSSGCRSLTDYIKKVLMNRPVKPISPVEQSLIECFNRMAEGIHKIEKKLDEEQGGENILNDSGILRTYIRTYNQKWCK